MFGREKERALDGGFFLFFDQRQSQRILYRKYEVIAIEKTVPENRSRYTRQKAGRRKNKMP